jgi:HEAT repeat protein
MTSDVAARLRAALEHADAGLRAAAARALGRLRDSSSVPSLIGRLEDSAPAVQRAARWALRECSGQDLASGEEWQRWLAAEREWWQEVGQRRLQALDPADSSGWAPALRELTAHPFVREPVAEALAERLGELGPELQVLACSTLGRLGARTAVPALIELLFEKDAVVREAAWEALRELTGQDLPAEPRLWEEYAFG